MASASPDQGSPQGLSNGRGNPGTLLWSRVYCARGSTEFWRNYHFTRVQRGGANSSFHNTRYHFHIFQRMTEWFPTELNGTFVSFNFLDLQNHLVNWKTNVCNSWCSSNGIKTLFVFWLPYICLAKEGRYLRGNHYYYLPAWIHNVGQP